jgi:hypothetical protein
MHAVHTTPYWGRLALTQVSNRVGVSLPSTENGIHIQFLKRFPVFSIPDDGQSPKPHISECQTPSSEPFKFHSQDSRYLGRTQSKGDTHLGIRSQISNYVRYGQNVSCVRRCRLRTWSSFCRRDPATVPASYRHWSVATAAA